MNTMEIKLDCPDVFETQFGTHGEIYSICKHLLDSLGIEKAPKSFLSLLSLSNQKQVLNLLKISERTHESFRHVATATIGGKDRLMRWINIPIYIDGHFDHFHGIGRFL